MSSNIILAIVGSRSIASEQLRDLGEIVDYALTRGPDLVISGGAAGVDAFAIRRAEHHGFKTVEFLPTHKRWEPQGYKERNLEIANVCTHLVCIRSTTSTSNGSGWTANKAEELGRHVEYFTV